VPHCIYVPCCNHSLDLCLRELARTASVISDTVEFVKNAANVIHESANRRQLYLSMFGEGNSVQELLSLCPTRTRWCIRGAAMKRLIENFKEVRSTLVELSESKNVRPSSQAVIKRLGKAGIKDEDIH